MNELFHKTKTVLIRADAHPGHTCVNLHMYIDIPADFTGAGGKLLYAVHAKYCRTDLLSYQLLITVGKGMAQYQNLFFQTRFSENKGFLRRGHRITRHVGKVLQFPADGHCPVSITIGLDNTDHPCCFRQFLMHLLHIITYCIKIHRRIHSLIVF